MLNPSESYDPRRFRWAVPFYARYRLPYPACLIERVSVIAGLEPDDAMLDLGSGPGLIAIAFAQAGMRVTAVDPEPDMLEAAGAAAAAAGVALDLRQGSSFALPDDIGPFKLVTIGRAFHWMDREQTLRDLDSLVTADGAVALFDDDHPKTLENAWRVKLRDIRDRYGRRSLRHVAEAETASFRSHESLLLDSSFPQLERCGVIVRRQITADEIVGLAFSQSTSSPEKLGEKAQDFERELRQELSALSPDGRFTEIAELSALVAQRRG
jgi:SAM-dependent methyltransferase